MSLKYEVEYCAVISIDSTSSQVQVTQDNIVLRKKPIT